MLGCKPAKSPLRSKTVMSLRKEGEEKADQARYLAAVGSLMYAMLGTRPDLAYPVGLLGRFASDPSVTHWDGAPTPFAITVTPLAPAVSPASRSVAIASSFQARTLASSTRVSIALSPSRNARSTVRRTKTSLMSSCSVPASISLWTCPARTRTWRSTSERTPRTLHSITLQSFATLLRLLRSTRLSSL